MNAGRSVESPARLARDAAGGGDARATVASSASRTRARLSGRALGHHLGLVLRRTCSALYLCAASLSAGAAPLMALEVFVGTVRPLTTDGLGTTYTLTPGFMTKAGIVFHTGRGDTTDASGGATMRRSIGFFTTANDERVCGSMSVDAAASGSGNEFNAIAGPVLAMYTADTTTQDGQISVDSITSTTCVFILNTLFAVNTTAGVMLFGGSDITNAAVIAFDIGTGTGTIDITTVGFQGTVLFLAGVDELGQTVDAAGAQLFFGACTGTGDEHVWWGGMDQGSTSADTGGYCLAGEVMVEWSGAINSPAAASNRAEFSAWLSNGFRLNRLITTRSGVDAMALVIQGGSWTVGDFTTRTTTGTIVESGFGYTPKGLIVVSALRVVSTSPNSTIDDQLSFGVTDGTTHHCQSMVDDDGPADMEVATAIDFDKVYVNIDITDTVVGHIDWTSWNSDGFTLTQNDADPTANFAFYIACGNTPVAFQPEEDHHWEPMIQPSRDVVSVYG